MEATGKLKPNTSELMIKSLLADVANLSPLLVMMALDQHKDVSSFWPFKADLMKFIQPELDRNQEKQTRINRMRTSMNYMLEGANQEDRHRIIGGFAEHGVTYEEQNEISSQAMPVEME